MNFTCKNCVVMGDGKGTVTETVLQNLATGFYIRDPERHSKVTVNVGLPCWVQVKNCSLSSRGRFIIQGSNVVFTLRNTSFTTSSSTFLYSSGYGTTNFYNCVFQQLGGMYVISGNVSFFNSTLDASGQFFFRVQSFFRVS
jgi:hypothetical protein